MAAFSYAHKYIPSMPVLQVALSYPNEAPLAEELLALVDTGADGTLAPIAVLSKFQLTESDRVWIRSQWGEHRSALRYVLDVHVGSVRLPAVQIIADDRGEDIILGRDILNKLRLLLDGPAETTEMLESKPRRK